MMLRTYTKLAVVLLAVAAASCGPSEKAKQAPADAPPAQAAVEPDPNPKNFGAPTREWQSGGDAILDDTLVRDVTFAFDGNGATIEVMVEAVDEAIHAQLLNNEGVVLGEADIAAGQEIRLTGQATGGNRNMVRLTRQIPRSAPARFALRIRTIPEAN